MEFILEKCASGVRAELETYDRVMEGLRKLGAYQSEPDTGVSFQAPHSITSPSIMSIPTHPGTEILPPNTVRTPTSLRQQQKPMQVPPRNGSMGRISSGAPTEIEQKKGLYRKNSRNDGGFSLEEEDYDIDFLKNALQNL
ncbi:hypothetical protein HK096_000985 [Nowakowskiella sp. JEL0078]|nr:hypothetical protein HK096_000985 [Nowakowskiella sp. JEL0078]